MYTWRNCLLSFPLETTGPVWRYVGSANFRQFLLNEIPDFALPPIAITKWHLCLTAWWKEYTIKISKLQGITIPTTTKLANFPRVHLYPIGLLYVKTSLISRGLLLGRRLCYKLFSMLTQGLALPSIAHRNAFCGVSNGSFLASEEECWPPHGSMQSGKLKTIV